MRPVAQPIVTFVVVVVVVAVSLLPLSSVGTPLQPPLAHPHPHRHRPLPSEAAVHMEGVMRFLPSSLQHLISSSEGFTPAFLQSLLLILACELGDRTFFVAAILAMKSSRIVVWCGALTALAAMTLLSAGIGKAFPLLLDKRWTSLAASALFFYFGVYLLRDWWRMRHAPVGENEELCEVENELMNDHASNKTLPSSRQTRDGSKDKWSCGSIMVLFSPVFAKAFSMTALAEWGDRSQIATIALAAYRDMVGVVVGAIIGHAICTGLAVIGGRLLASSISERAVALMGGLLFISFAILSVTGILD